MNPTEQKVEEILGTHDDDLNPIEDKSPKEGAEDESKPTDGDTNPTNGGGDSDPTPEEPIQPEGFTADEVKPDEAEPEEEVTPPAPSTANPELKFIADNLPVVPARILQDGKVVETSVKSYTQLPDDVEFASQKDFLSFQAAMGAQERLAENLQGQYRQNEQNKIQSDFEQRENTQIRTDITKLQTEGRLPKFTVQPDDPKFADNENTQEVQKVLDFMNQRNQQYLDNYNKGSAYKHIGFEEAYEMMPETRQKEAQKEAQEQEDATRQKNAGKLGNSSGGTVTDKPRVVPRGTSLDAIVDYWERTL